MKIIRFILPFLFVRNWHNGTWELSRARLIAFTTALFFVGVLLVGALYLQAPVEFSSETGIR